MLAEPLPGVFSIFISADKNGERLAKYVYGVFENDADLEGKLRELPSGCLLERIYTKSIQHAEMVVAQTNWKIITNNLEHGGIYHGYNTTMESPVDLIHHVNRLVADKASL